MSASTGVGNCCRRDSHSDALPGTEACKTFEDTGPVSSDGDVPLPWWYSPRRLLALYCFVWFLVYVDTGLLSSNGVTGTRSTDPNNTSTDAASEGGMQADFNLTYAQLGLLPAMFMAGLMLACLVFNELCNYINSFRLIGIGLGMWMLGAIFTGVSQSFGFLLFARIFMGAGEASIMTLTGPFIDDVAPPASKAQWFALLSLFPSLGVAVGYLYGDLATIINWRICFYIEAAVALPIVLFCLFATPVRLRGKAEEMLPSSRAQEGKMVKAKWHARLVDGWKDLGTELKILHQQPVFLANAWGFVPVQACLGVFTFWGPKAAKEILRADENVISYLLGGITVGTAVVGTIGGGWLLDRVGSSLRNAMTIQFCASIVALVFCMLAFLTSPPLPVFAPLLSIGLLGIFVTTAPLYAVSMWSVPVPQRPFGQAFQVITMHLFGDVPSPPIIGAIQGRLLNWRTSMAIIVATLGISIASYLFGVLYSPRAIDYREERQPPKTTDEEAREQGESTGAAAAPSMQ
ncbi:g341 [Coccomyxa elongata]